MSIEEYKGFLRSHGMLNFKPMSTPIELNAKLYREEGNELANSTMYRQLVGS